MAHNRPGQEEPVKTPRRVGVGGRGEGEEVGDKKERS